ncbi:alkaline phosphatase family protein [Stackebrandtia soli]|uniref:alkaline phosphatase family protein n=1 Tax=Stackebrandtia soli TaxID=1892856 RepID=UPI0039E8194A
MRPTLDLSVRLPAYGRASICDVMPSVLSLLGVPGGRDVLGLADGPLAGVNRVAILLIDGLGLYPLRLAADRSPLISDIVTGNVGRFDELTTNFPSTTPTSLTSLGTGATPGEHGVLGFTVNVPGTTDVLTHIEWADKPDPLSWQPIPTGFERAAAAGVSTAKVSQVFSFDGLNTAAFRGSETFPAPDMTATADGVIAALSVGEKSLVYGYNSIADKTGHGFGLESPQWWNAVTEVENLIAAIMTRLPTDAGLIVTADHGMINIADADKIDVTDLPALHKGVRLIAGEPRARYLHTEPGAATAVAERWREFFGDVADVRTRDSAIEAGWFGPVAAEHRERIGDVVVACVGRSVILGAPSERPTIGLLRGYHGGLTDAEMSIGLWSYRGMS